MAAWLKAGLIGTVILVILQLIGWIPAALCFTLPLTLFAYVVIGVLAAAFLAPPRSAGRGALQGTLATLISSVINGLFGLGISFVQASSTDTATAISQLPPELLQPLYEVGLSPDVFFGVGGVLFFGGLCCTVSVVVALTLGAIGGGGYAVLQPE